MALQRYKLKLKVWVEVMTESRDEAVALAGRIVDGSYEVLANEPEHCGDEDCCGPQMDTSHVVGWFGSGSVKKVAKAS